MPGAFQAGALHTMVHSLPAGEVAWDVVRGISVGALNAGGMSLHAIGTEKEMIEDIINNVWMKIGTEGVYRYWNDDYMTWPLEAGLVDNTPLKEFITAFMGDKPIKRRIIATSVDANDGIIYRKNENGPRSDLINSIIASASVPGVFPPQYVNGKVLIDGMAARNIDLSAILERCKEIVSDEADIIVDLIDCDTNIIKPFEEDGGAHNNLMRGMDVRAKNHNRELILQFHLAHPSVQMRYMVMAPFDISDKHFQLDFDKATVADIIEIGKSAAGDTLNKGPGFGIKWLQEWGVKRDVKEQAGN